MCMGSLQATMTKVEMTAKLAMQLAEKMQGQIDRSNKDLVNVLNTNIHDAKDLEVIITYLLEQSKLSILLYDTTIDYRWAMSDDMLRKVFNKLEEQRLRLKKLEKDLDNRDLPRYHKLKELLGIGYLD